MMASSHASTSGTAADDFETRLRIMNENLTFSERLEYLDDPDWAAFISASDSPPALDGLRSNDIDLLLDPASNTQLYGFNAESWTNADYMSGNPRVDIPMSEGGELRDTIFDNTSIRQESSHSSVGHPTSQDSDNNAVSGYQCADCSKRYRRKTDLSRHAKTHNKEGRIDCPIPSCKYRGTKGNTRRDKFTNHLVRGHPEAETWPCLVRGCSEAFDNALLLGVHLDSHKTGSLGYSIIKAHSIQKTRCPIERCGRPLSPNHLFGNHTQMERQAEADRLYALGFDYQQSALLCPACDEKFLCSTEVGTWIKEDLPKLREHMGVKHLGYEENDWVPDRHVQDSERLLSMWKDPHTLYHCREQILRFSTGAWFQGFNYWRESYLTHAIFDDVRA